MGLHVLNVNREISCYRNQLEKYLHKLFTSLCMIQAPCGLMIIEMISLFKNFINIRIIPTTYMDSVKV